MFTNEQFTALAKQHMDTVFRTALSYLKSPADADDITQTVLMKLYRYDGTFESDAHIRNWLIRVTVNACKSALRSPWRRMEDIEEYANSIEFPTREHSELFEAVMALPANYRVVIYLFYYEGYSTRELANILSVPEATVRTRLMRGREKLRKTLTEADIEDGQTAF